MPTYDYRCDKCNTVTERVASIDDRDVPCYCGATVPNPYPYGRGRDMCMGRLNRMFSPPKAVGMFHVESRMLQADLKAQGKFCPGDASLDEMNKFWDRKEADQEKKLDDFCMKKAEECVTTLGSSGLYSRENQQRGDVIQLPEALRGKV